MKSSAIDYDPSTDFVYKDNHSVENGKPKLPPVSETEISIPQASGDETLKETIWRPDEAPINKRNFKYDPCQPNINFTQLKYVTTEYSNLSNHSGFSVTDRSDAVYLFGGCDSAVEDADEGRISRDVKGNNGCVVLNGDGWRTARSNTCIKEGYVYWELQVVNVDVNNNKNIRFGISRREASLEAPVGFDAYGYGLRDKTLQSIFGGKLTDCLKYDGAKQLQNGDTIGLLLYLPELSKQIEQANLYKKECITNFNYSTDTNTTKTSTAASRNNKFLQEQFEKELLKNCDPGNVTRDQIAIRYKSMLLFESTDYVKEDITFQQHQKKKKKQEQKIVKKKRKLSMDIKEEEEQKQFNPEIADETCKDHHLEGSFLKVFINGELLGDAFQNFKPVLPPFSQLKYNDKVYFNYWKTGKAINDQEERDFLKSVELDEQHMEEEHENTPHTEEDQDMDPDSKVHEYKRPLNKQAILKNKFCNNNRLGYYPTVSCFNEGAVKLLGSRKSLKYWASASQTVPKTHTLQTLDDVFTRQVADDIVWDLIDEVEAEFIGQ